MPYLLHETMVGQQVHSKFHSLLLEPWPVLLQLVEVASLEYLAVVAEMYTKKLRKVPIQLALNILEHL